MVIVFVPQRIGLWDPFQKWPFYGLYMGITNHLRPSWDDHHDPGGVLGSPYLRPPPGLPLPPAMAAALGIPNSPEELRLGRFGYPSNSLHNWVFPKIGVPQNGWLIMENPIKMDDLGVPLFLETLNYHGHKIFGSCFYPYAHCSLLQSWFWSGFWVPKHLPIGYLEH